MVVSLQTSFKNTCWRTPISWSSMESTWWLHGFSIEFPEIGVNQASAKAHFWRMSAAKPPFRAGQIHRHPAATPFVSSPCPHFVRGLTPCELRQLLSRYSKLFALFPSSSAQVLCTRVPRSFGEEDDLSSSRGEVWAPGSESQTSGLQIFGVAPHYLLAGCK